MPRTLAVRRALAAVAVAPLLLTGVAACGDSGGSQAQESSQSAVLASLQKGDTVDPSEFVDTVTHGLEKSTTAHMTMRAGAGATGSMTAEGDIDYTAKPPAMAMTMSVPMGGQTSSMEARLVDGVMYLSLGDLSGGKFWKLDLSDKSGPLAGMGTMLDQMDPSQTLKKLEPAIDTVTYGGQEDVDGRTVGHYRLTVDPAKVGKAMGAPSGARAQLPDALTYDVWLDEQDRMAKVSMDIPVRGVDASFEMEMSDWGEKVDIQAPPADQVTQTPDFGSMMQPTPST